MKVKVCKECNHCLPIENFRVTYNNYTQPYCKPCERSRGRKYYSDNRERMKEHLRHKSRKILYGITKEQFESLIEKQNNSCAICGIKEPGGKGNWHVDHDHTTGIIRGLLCHKCNTGLGLFRESKLILSEAINYLEKYE